MIRTRYFVLMLIFVAWLSAASQTGGQLRFCLHSEPKTFNPILVEDDASETIRYLTGGVLIRLDRGTQQLKPELATEWKVSKDGRTIDFSLRKNVSFSDGTPFTATDVAFTMKQLMDPAVHSPTGDSFRSSAGEVVTSVVSANEIKIVFPAPVAGLDGLFDQVAIMSSTSPLKEKAVLGPFTLAEYKPGSHVLLGRNPNYWKRDSAGRRLPYFESVKLDIQQNRDIEAMRFQRHEIHLINSLDSQYFDQMSGRASASLHDAGASLDSEEVWFNQVATAPIPEYKRDWFKSIRFRNAVSTAINRADIVRLVFNSHATPAAGPVSPANRFWFDSKLKPLAFNPSAALILLKQDGFEFKSGVLTDRGGHRVEFSILTNSGNRSRERMATMIQQDLSQVGIKVNVVTLDFPSLIERITRSFDYEACLLGLVNTDLDPNGQMNIWLSSSENHQWNPKQKVPSTPWEAEIDKLMRAQGSSMNNRERKKLFDRVQEIVSENEPFIYLVHKNVLSAISSDLHGVTPSVLRPQTFWQADTMSLGMDKASN